VTNRLAPDRDAVIDLIDWYRALVLYMIVAWRIGRRMRLSRNCPDLDASLFFHADEIKDAYLLAKKARPTSAPTLNQMIRLIAPLGGFLGRKAMANPVPKPSGSDFSAPWMLLLQSRCHCRTGLP
jgi:hypothetical protein